MSTCWTSTGTAFNITDVDRFERNVLPRISERSSSFFSFRRRMYTWGFTRPRKGPNAGSYYHRLFQRDNPGLCHSMLCQGESKKTKQSTSRAPDLDLTMDQGNGLLPLTTRDVHADNSSSAEFEAPSANIAMLANVLAANASPIAERYDTDNNATMYPPSTNPRTLKGARIGPLVAPTKTVRAQLEHCFTVLVRWQLKKRRTV